MRMVVTLLLCAGTFVLTGMIVGWALLPGYLMLEGADSLGELDSEARTIWNAGTMLLGLLAAVLVYRWRRREE